jgi:hypothetical protein
MSGPPLKSPQPFLLQREGFLHTNQNYARAMMRQLLHRPCKGQHQFTKSRSDRDVVRMANVSFGNQSRFRDGLNYRQRLCFCSGAFSKPRPVPETKRWTKIKLNTNTSWHHCRNIVLPAVV